MIHLERQKSRAFARIYFYEDSFCFQFLPRQFELFELSKEEQIRIVNNDFSAYECDKYLELFKKFKTFKKIKFGSQKKDFCELWIEANDIGFISQNDITGSFLINIITKKGIVRTRECLKKKFSSMNEAKDYISKNYALLQIKYNLYLQNDCV